MDEKLKSAYIAAGVTMGSWPEISDADAMKRRLRDFAYDLPPALIERNLEGLARETRKSREAIAAHR